MVRYARWSFRCAGQFVLDGMDCVSTHLDLVAFGSVCAVWIWHPLHFHHELSGTFMFSMQNSNEANLFLQYIIDSYEAYAASALASITLIRYVAAGGMTIVGIPFYENLGVHYTLTILACLSIPLVPAPYVLYKYGPWIRSKSKYAVNSTTGRK